MSYEMSGSDSLSCSGSEEAAEDVPNSLQDLLLSDVEVSGRELGMGSYSSVLELSYKGLKCAGKKLHRNLYDQGLAIGPEILERFGVECELLSQLRHPRVVQFLGLHYEEGGMDVPILVMEFMPWALSDIIEQYGRLPDEISFSILNDVSIGLHFFHTHHPPIIHRDLTANNVLLTPDMSAKISDLGMAKILNIAPAEKTRRMTTCPGTVSYMPPEALTSNPQYDTKLDCFSFGVLTTHIFCGEWPIASEYLQPDPQNPGHLFPLTEIQRREKYLKRMGENHKLSSLTRHCLRNLPSERPDASEILERMKEVVTNFPMSYENRIEMLNQIKADGIDKIQLKAEVEQLRRSLHEKEHAIEQLNTSCALEMESMKEQVMRLEQIRALHEMQLSQLQSENSRIQHLLASKREEVNILRTRETTLATELMLVNTKLEEKAAQSLQKMKKVQAEVIKSSLAREEALKRMTSHQLQTALKASFGGQDASRLSMEYEDFFLSNADDIAELMKKLPRSGCLTQLQAQQMVCNMILDCYSHCQEKVVGLAARQLTRLFSLYLPEEDVLDHSFLHDLSIAYGLLVRQAVISPQLCDELSQELFPKFLEHHSLRVPSRSTEASLRHHMTHACKLTLDLVSSWPPLIISKPTKFHEDWQDREFQYWDKSPPITSKRPPSSTPQCVEVKLLYTRPVLFESYAGKVGAKGWVGNKDKELMGTRSGATRNRRRISNSKGTKTS